MAVNDVTGLLDINALDEKYQKREVECRSYNFKDANSGKLSGNNREKGKTLYIGLQGSPLYFCLYEKDKEQGYYIETPKTKSGVRNVPLSRETIQAFHRVIKNRPKAEPFVIDGYSNFLFINGNGNPKVAVDYNAIRSVQGWQART